MIDNDDPRLTDYVLGELSSSEMIEIDQAVKESSDLAAAVEEIRGVVGLLGEAYSTEEKLSLSGEQKLSLKAETEASESSAPRWVALAIAASVTLLASFGWVAQDYYQNDRRRDRTIAKYDALYEGVDQLSPAEVVIEFPDADEWREKGSARSNYQDVELGGEININTMSSSDTELATQLDGQFRDVLNSTEARLEDSISRPLEEALPESIAPDSYDGILTMPAPSFYRDSVATQNEYIYGDFATEGPLRGRSIFEDSSSVDLGLPHQGQMPAQAGQMQGQASLAAESLAFYSRRTVDSPTFRFRFNGQRRVSNQSEMLEQEYLAIAGDSDDESPLHARDEVSKQSKPSALQPNLMDAIAKKELIRQKVGTGHPNYESAIAKVESIKRELEERESRPSVRLKLNSIRDARDAFQRAAEAFGNLETAKASGSSEQQKEQLGRIESHLSSVSLALGEIADYYGADHKNVNIILQQFRSLNDSLENERRAYLAANTGRELKRSAAEEKPLEELEGAISAEIDPAESQKSVAEILVEAEARDKEHQILTAEDRDRIIEKRVARDIEGLDLASLEQGLKKFERAAQSKEGIQTRVWELQQERLLFRDDDSRRTTETAPLRLLLTEAEAEVQRVMQNVGEGHPDYESAVAKVRTVRKQLIELVAEIEATALNIKEIPDEILFERYRQAYKNQIAKLKAESNPKSWKRVKAIPNTTRLMVGDKEELTLNGMQVNAQVDGFRARVLVDYFYYNDREQQLEGNFKLRLPDDASLYYFAFGESVYDFSPEGKLAADEFLSDGAQFVSLGATDVKQARKGQWDNVKEARMVPKEKAAHAFRETVRRRVDPALVEWSGAGVFNARVFPLSPKKLHRIVVGYDVNLKRSKDGLNFELNLPEQTGQCRVEVNVQEIEGVTYKSTPEVDPIPSAQDGKLQKRFVFNNDEELLAKVEIAVSGANELLLESKANNDTDDQNEGVEFWTFQVAPELPAEEAASNSRAIFMVDTSLSCSPDKFNVWLELLESTLDNNRDSLKEFGVLFFNIDQHFWKNNYVANTPENVAQLKTTLQSLVLEGATDLFGAVEAVSKADWVTAKGNRPDLFLLGDGAATWGETDLRLINQLLQKPELGSLFAYQTGLSGTSIRGLRFLAGQSGGAVFSIATEDEIKLASTAHRKRPWKLKSIKAEGASDILTAGRVQWFYPGQAITIVGRGKVRESVVLDFQQGNESKSIILKPKTIESELASRMYGHVAVGQLESLGEQVFDVSAAYARHFRVTGQTCSLLMLDTEEDYKRFDIKPQEDLFVVKAKSASKLIVESLAKFSADLADPKAKLMAWLNRLESMPGMNFKIPTALKLALDDMKVEAISGSLECSLTTRDSVSESWLDTIAAENLDYERVQIEANRRAAKTIDEAIKVYSSLVERNPGDITVARDIAFTAMEMDRPAQAFHLLRRVAKARPFQGNIYPAIGQCLAQVGQADMAIIYYEVAMNGTFQRQGSEFKQIVAAEYTHLLRQIVSGKLKSSVEEFAAARLDTLVEQLPFETADVIVTMMWNQDQTDVDLHVYEPSGEECFYSHAKTASGGQITSDIRTGFGPEMYFNADAPHGKYKLKAKYFSNGQNRTSTRNKVYLTVIRGFGTENESMTRRTIQLKTVGKKESVMTVGVGE